MKGVAHALRCYRVSSELNLKRARIRPSAGSNHRPVLKYGPNACRESCCASISLGTVKATAPAKCAPVSRSVDADACPSVATVRRGVAPLGNARPACVNAKQAEVRLVKFARAAPPMRVSEAARMAVAEA